jgi:metal-responsive CopG/Arc/MetJ family transcriptional regulator
LGKQRITVTIDYSVVERLDRVCEKLLKKRSNLVQRSVVHMLDEVEALTDLVARGFLVQTKESSKQ